jgi:energy-coupling factor transporter ATP-binding protein EcfA2
MDERQAQDTEQGNGPPIIPALVITGPVGAGKSTTASALSELLSQHEIRHAVIDEDYLRWVYPHPEGDRFGMQLGLRNLAAIWPNLRETGLACIILADVVEDRAQVAEYEAAMPGTTVTVVRLDVPMPIIIRRLEGRESDTTIDWYRHRAPELQGIMERGRVEDLLIDVGDRPPHDVAREIALRTHLLAPDPSPSSSYGQPCPAGAPADRGCDRWPTSATTMDLWERD